MKRETTAMADIVDILTRDNGNFNADTLDDIVTALINHGLAIVDDNGNLQAT